MTSGFNDWRLGRVPALDGIRALAALAVLLDHTGLWGFEGGGLGVDVFFTLSGFLITGMLLEELKSTGRVALGSFWIHRSLRLMPSILALVAAVIILHNYMSAATMRGVLPTLFYWSNWHRAFFSDIGVLGHTWSLSIEEQFYLIWPVVLLLTLRYGGPRAALRCTVAGVILIVVVREVVFQLSLASEARIYNGLDYRSDALLVGCAVALAAHTRGIPAWLSKWSVSLLLGFALVFIGREFWGAPVYLERTYTALMTAALIAVILAGTVPRINAVLGHPVMRWLGVRSYAIYLWHYPVCSAVRGDYAVPLEVGMSIGLAALSYQFVEVPFQRIRARLKAREALKAPGSAPSIAAAPAASRPKQP